MCVFVFFKQKTAYEMRISDWSSDVCSSDLEGRLPGDPGAEARMRGQRGGIEGRDAAPGEGDAPLAQEGIGLVPQAREAEAAAEIGRASCRERVCQYV